jgi:hypothetical protein
MPVEKSGFLQLRTTLFRTAAYYALSLKGVEEDECLTQQEFPGFVFISGAGCEAGALQYIDRRRDLLAGGRHAQHHVC